MLNFAAVFGPTQQLFYYKSQDTLKKVALSLVALFALAMVSCNGNKENTTEAPATDSPVVEAPADSANVQK